MIYIGEHCAVHVQEQNCQPTSGRLSSTPTLLRAGMACLVMLSDPKIKRSLSVRRYLIGILTMSVATIWGTVWRDVYLKSSGLNRLERTYSWTKRGKLYQTLGTNGEQNLHLTLDYRKAPNNFWIFLPHWWRQLGITLDLQDMCS